MPKYTLKDSRGDGGAKMPDDHPPLSRDENFEPPEKDPGRTITAMPRLKGSMQPLGSKVRTAPSHG